MSEISDRLKGIRTTLGLKQREIEFETGLKQAALSKLESGAIKSIPEEYILFLNKRGVNINYLYTGNGEMLEQKEKGLPSLSEVSDQLLSLNDPKLSDEVRSARVHLLADVVRKIYDDNDRLKALVIQAMERLKRI